MDEVLFSSVIEACIRIGQLDEPMDEVLFSSVIEACIRIGQLDLLSKKMRKYASQGGLMALTAPTYGSMIKAYGQARDVERIWELWMEMRGREVKPTMITLGCMIDALVMNSCVDDAWDLVQKVYKDEEQRASVNTVIYSTILKGFAISKQPQPPSWLSSSIASFNKFSRSLTTTRGAKFASSSSDMKPSA